MLVDEGQRISHSASMPSDCSYELCTDPIRFCHCRMRPSSVLNVGWNVQASIFQGSCDVLEAVSFKENETRLTWNI